MEPKRGAGWGRIRGYDAPIGDARNPDLRDTDYPVIVVNTDEPTKFTSINRLTNNCGYAIHMLTETTIQFCPSWRSIIT